MRVWFFVLVSLALALAAPRAAGAGVELTGLGGWFVLHNEESVGFGAATLRAHVSAGPSASYGLEAGYGRLADEHTPVLVVLPALYEGPFPSTLDRREHLAWLTASVKARGAGMGASRPYALLLAGVADHATRSGVQPVETVHNGRFMMGLGAGIESAGSLGPVFEVRAISTGLQKGTAIGVAANVGIRFAP